MSGFSHVGERILLTLWIGGMWTVGFLVAPTLFQMLGDNRMLAGNIAGRLFTLSSYLGLICGGLLLFGAVLRTGRDWWRTTRVWVLLTMLIIIVIGEFIFAPMMIQLKLSGLPAGSSQALQFGRLHGITSTLFLINSLLGLGLVAYGYREQDR